MSQSFSFECFLKRIKFNNSVIYFQFMISIIYPLLIFLIAIIFFINKKFYPESNTTENIPKASIMKNILIVIIITCMPDIFQRSMQLFLCTNIGDNSIIENRIPTDIKIKCFGKENHNWKYYGSFPSLIVFIVIFSIYILIVMRKLERIENFKRRKIYLYLWLYF